MAGEISAMTEVGGVVALTDEIEISRPGAPALTRRSALTRVKTLLGGQVVQVVNTQTGAVATGTTDIPVDDTIPQNTEGDEYMTRAITPTSATHKLKIDVVMNCSHSQEAWLTVALFQDATANALAGARGYMITTTSGQCITFSHYMTAGTTSETTFKVRAGSGGAGTFTFNGSGGTRHFGGVLASSITITEIRA